MYCRVVWFDCTCILREIYDDDDDDDDDREIQTGERGRKGIA